MDTVDSLPKPPNLMDWLGDMIAFKDEEREEIVDNMLHTYINTIADEHPQRLDALVEYIANESGRKEFILALNNINLVVALTFIAEDDIQFQQGIRRLLMEARQDSEHSTFMKYYYLDNLDYDDFSGIVFKQEDFDLIQERFNYFKTIYQTIKV